MIADVIFIAAVVGLLIAIYKIKFSKQNLQREIEDATKQAELKKELKIKKQLSEKELKENNQQTADNSEVVDWQNDSQSQEDEKNPVNLRKQLRKEQKQKEKQQRKEAQEQYLQSEKQKKEKYEKQVQERQKLEQQKKKKQEEILEQLREEERKRKQEQFNKWKDLFSVEETGKEKLSIDEQKLKIQTFNKNFIAIIKKNKLSLLQDLSHKFKMTTKDLVDKIRQFEDKKLISGIFDERGKYLVIESDQWEAIKNYITAKGRVKKTDIMKQCARLIKIPDNREEQLLNLIELDQQN